MKKICALIFFILSSLVQPVGAMAAPLPEQEKLVYRLRWLGIPAGEIVTEIKGPLAWEGHSVYKIEVKARTIGLCARLYRVKDVFISYVDAEKFHSLRYEVRREEGRYRKNAVTRFDQEKQKAYFKNYTDGSTKELDMPRDVLDTVAASYVARTRALLPGGRYRFAVYNDEKDYVIDLLVTGKGLMQVAGQGNVEVVYLQPTACYGNERVRAGRLTSYVTADPGHYPVRVVIKAPVFTQLTAVLSQ